MEAGTAAPQTEGTEQTAPTNGATAQTDGKPEKKKRGTRKTGQKTQGRGKATAASKNGKTTGKGKSATKGKGKAAKPKSTRAPAPTEKSAEVVKVELNGEELKSRQHAYNVLNDSKTVGKVKFTSKKANSFSGTAKEIKAEHGKIRVQIRGKDYSIWRGATSNKVRIRPRVA